MIAENITETIRSQLASDIVVEPEDDKVFSISMPFVFEDGDPCAFRLKKVGRTWTLDDEGGTIRRASFSGADLLEPGHVDRLHKIAGFYGLKERHGVLSLPISGKGYSDAIYSFTQACLEIINLAKLPKERPETDRHDFQERLASVIESSVPKNKRIHRWHHPEFDPAKVYEVDYLVKGKSKDWYVFGIGGPLAAHLATIACYHYRDSGAKFGSVAIYEHEEKMRTRETVPLNEIVTRKFPRVGEARSIRNFFAKDVA